MCNLFPLREFFLFRVPPATVGNGSAAAKVSKKLLLLLPIIIDSYLYNAIFRISLITLFERFNRISILNSYPILSNCKLSVVVHR